MSILHTFIAMWRECFALKGLREKPDTVSLSVSYIECLMYGLEKVSAHNQDIRLGILSTLFGLVGVNFELVGL